MKTNNNTKTAGYREALGHIARSALSALDLGLDPIPSLAATIEMTVAIFDRPAEKVLTDLSKALAR